MLAWKRPSRSTGLALNGHTTPRITRQCVSAGLVAFMVCMVLLIFTNSFGHIARGLFLRSSHTSPEFSASDFRHQARFTSEIAQNTQHSGSSSTFTAPKRGDEHARPPTCAAEVVPNAASTSIEVFTSLPPLTTAELDEMSTMPNPLLHRTLLALASWLYAGPGVRVTVLGRQPEQTRLSSLLSVAVLGEVGGRLSFSSRVDLSFAGKPLINSMWRTAEASSAHFTAFAHPDVYVQATALWRVLARTACHHEDFVLLASAMDAEQHLPALTTALQQPSHASEAALWEAVKATAGVRDGSGVDLWLWNSQAQSHSGANRRSNAVIDGVIPPFSFGRSRYDHWITHELVAQRTDGLVDATHALALLHVKQTRNLARWPLRSLPIKVREEPTADDWDVYANAALSETDSSFHPATPQHAPLVLLPCEEASTGHICFVKRAHPGACSCELSVWSASSDIELHSGARLPLKQPLTGFPVEASNPPGGRHTLATLLETFFPPHEDQGVSQVILLAATMDYRDMVMNWVCNYRRLQAASLTPLRPFIIAALDEDFFRFGFLQGLPVFYGGNHTMQGTNGADCAYGTPCFRAITKLKSRLVLQILKMGVDVFFTDADIIWFSDPFQHPEHFDDFASKTTIFVQSNEPDASLPLNGVRRINSGFYFVPSSADTISAFEEVVAHAAASKLSEQPSFYDVLCGVNGVNRVGTDACEYGNVRIEFLPLEQFPNGASFGHWDARERSRSKAVAVSTQESCARLGCVILHDNWVTGILGKRERLETEGFWYTDMPEGTCRYD